MSIPLSQASIVVRTQACVPCARRKVKCDRQEPCSNCKRRKTDICTYLEVSANERIRKLEALVRSLGGDPDDLDHRVGNEVARQRDHNGRRPSSTQGQNDNQFEPQIRSVSGEGAQQGSESVMIKEEEDPVYLESSAWHSWNGRHVGPIKGLQSSPVEASNIPLLLASVGSDVMASLLMCNSDVDFQTRHPDPRLAKILWDTFFQNVHPIVKIFFDWEVDRLRSATVSPHASKNFSNPEHALLFNIYLLSVLSLKSEVCQASLGRDKSELLAEYQWLSEQALGASNFLGNSDLLTLQALVLYVASSLQRLKANGLWSLMGLISRKAERLGLHRDGTMLDLSPYETERRRRTWWQLQHIDLAVSTSAGSTPLSFVADWDTKLPLNIEDHDISPSMKEAPKERFGLTSMSHCLWRYWVIQEQRSFKNIDGGRFGLSWVSNTALSYSAKEALVKRLEDGLNERYLRFCDPIKSLDVLILICARALLTGLRRWILLPLPHGKDKAEPIYDHRNKLTSICMQCLEYDVAIHATQAIQYFRWTTQGYFQWSALIYILIEAQQVSDTPRAAEIWALISKIYAVKPEIMNISGDRRKTYAAELIVAAWKSREALLLDQCQKFPNYYAPPQKPSFIAELESQLPKAVIGPTSLRETPQQDYSPRSSQTPNSIATTLVTSEYGQVQMPAFGSYTQQMPKGSAEPYIFGSLNFEDIDWTFWDSLEESGPFNFLPP